MSSFLFFSFLSVIPLISSATVPRKTFYQFYHVYVHEIMTNQVTNEQEFLNKLNMKLKRSPSGEAHWLNAQTRFELVRSYLKKLPSHTFPKTLFDETFLPFHVSHYTLLTLTVFSTNPSKSELLFEDAYFYWCVLRTKVGDDFEKRRALLEVLEMLRNIGLELMFTNQVLSLSWIKYYPDSLFLKNMLNFNKADTRKVKFFSGNAVNEEAFDIVLRETHNPSNNLQTRFKMFEAYFKGILQLKRDPRLELSTLDMLEMHSQLGPLQDYFPKFMKERSTNLARSFLVITLSRRYLQKMEQTGHYPSIILENAGVAISHLCNIYLAFWQSFPLPQVSIIFSQKLNEYMNEKVKPLKNFINGCTAESFDSVLTKFGISGIALPRTPHDCYADSLAIVEQKEFRLSLEAFAYQNFYSARFRNKFTDMEAHFKGASKRPPEDKEFAALVLSWIKAKTYPNLKLPFNIAEDQNEKVVDFSEYANEMGVYSLEEDTLWKEFKLNHVLQKLELERIVYDMSDDPVWKELQMDYIHRLDSFVKLMPR